MKVQYQNETKARSAETLVSTGQTRFSRHVQQHGSSAEPQVQTEQLWIEPTNIVWNWKSRVDRRHTQWIDSNPTPERDGTAGLATRAQHECYSGAAQATRVV